MKSTSLQPLSPTTSHRNIHIRIIHKFSRSLLFRLGAILILGGLLISGFYSASSAATSAKTKTRGSVDVARQTTVTSLNTLPTGVRALPSVRASFSPLALPLPPSSPSIGTYASGCSTPQTDFAVGETVCVKVTGIPTGSFFPYRLLLGNANSTIVQSADITSDPQTLSFVVPATSVIGGVTVDNRGTWQAVVVDPFFFFPYLRTRFTISDPQNKTADLGVTTLSSSGEVQAGSQAIFKLQVKNYGPDSALSVQLTDDVPANTTFNSFQQVSGPTFVCNSPSMGSSTGTTTCTLASFAWPGPDAVFLAIYDVNAGTPANTLIVNTANVTSSTDDQNVRNGSTSATVTVVNASGGNNCSFDCPANIIATATSSSGAVVNFGSANNISGTCGAISANPSSGSVFPVGTTVVNVTSDSGPSCSFTVTVSNTPAPTISCPADKIATADSNGTATVAPGVPSTNPSMGVTVSGVRSDDGGALTDPYPIGTTGITWTVTDSIGRTASCTQRIIVHGACATDSAPPTITAPPDITVGTGPNSTTCGAVLDDELGTPDAQDDCSVSVSSSGIPPGNLFPIGTTTITYTATDGAGHTASAVQNVTVFDNTPPVIVAPANASYTCLSEVPAADLSQAHGTDPSLPDGGPPTDNCGSPTVTVSETSSGAGSVASPRIILRTFTATDSHNNIASAVQTITVIDPTPPTITLDGANPQYVECHTSYTELGATAHDNCSADFAATPSGAVDVNTPGTYTVTYNANDAAGNAATSVTRTVIVQDTIAPTITLNGANPQYVECHTSYTDLGATAHDNCSGDFAATPSGAVNVNTPGSYTVTYNANDAAGNAATPVTRTVIVQDTIAPTITLNSYAPSMWPPNHKYSTFQLTQFVTAASDSCDTTLNLNSVVIEKVTSDEIENGNGDGNTMNDIIIAANCKSVQLRSEREGGSNGRVYTITFRVKDASGNAGRATARVVVPHNPGETVVDSGVHYTVNGSCP